MKRRLIALVALALLLAAVVIGSATAAPPPLTPAQAQAMGQDAASGQRADTTAGSGQYQPANQSVPTRIGSKGDGGDVTQTNASAAAAISANENKTDQSADQTQSGGAGGSYGQAAGQAADSEQKAKSDADSTQVKPSNVNVPIRIGSKGDGGDVTQTNASAAAAASANENKTDQDVDQTQSGGGSKDGSCCSDASYDQAAGQDAKNEQKAESDADSTQKAPSNINVPIRILSPGDDGDVTQTNASAAVAASANGNKTDQDVDQTQSGAGSKDGSCCSDASYSQAAGQESKNEQKAESDADSTQVKPRNINVPIRILSPGDDGDVTQTNASVAGAASLNGNKTDQDVDQTQSGGGSKDGSKCCSDASYDQAAGQESKSEQTAKSDADSTQYGATNINVPIRIGSKGDGGNVTQTNASLAAALSANANKTDQDIDQTQGGGKPAKDSRHDPKCGCSSDALYSQSAGQESKNDQWADSDAESKQAKPSNVNTPVRIGSKGHDGDVTQTNLSAAVAASLNGNETDQDVDQTQGGSKRDPRNGVPYGSSYDPGHDSCCGSAIYIQAAGQESKSEQGARSDADSTQYGASNTNAPVRIDSKGGGGDVTQTNASLAAAISANGNKTDQDVDQTQPGGLIEEPKRDSRCCDSDALYIQAVGQSAKNDQWADSEADSKQVKPSNTNAPVRIDSKGHDGDVTQTNASLAAAVSANANKTDQDVDQTQGGSKRDSRNGVPYGSSYDSGHDSTCCGSAIYVQAAGQESKSEQGARSDADSTQYGASNTNVPVRIDSKGGGGDVTQTNLSAALGASLNANETDQDLDQTQGESKGRKHDPRNDSHCGCSDALYVQAAGQESHNDQWADSDAESSQHGASNVWDPVRIDSKGREGDVTQLNASVVAAAAANGNKSRNDAKQHQAGSGSSYEQTLGQSAGNRQKAGSDARSKQGKAKSKKQAPSHKRGGRHLVD